jgi:hypothetical protein
MVRVPLTNRSRVVSCPHPMSTSKLDTSGVFEPVKLHSQRIQITLPSQAAKIRKNGIEFLAAAPVPTWTEMSVELSTLPNTPKVHCNGIVVSCSGNRHTGYMVSMIFMNLSRQAQQRLDQWSATAR